MPVTGNFQTCPHAKLWMLLAWETENSPRLTQQIMQFSQDGDGPSIGPQLPSGEAHATLGSFDPEQIAPTALL
jgi:hypothetical protein